MAAVTYCTREMVQRELGFADLPRLNARVDRACRAGAYQLETFLHRKFYPILDSRSFDLPRDGVLWLYEHELSGTPTSIVTGGQTLTTADYILRPESGPPYRWIEINTSGSRSWESGDTPQNSTVITGLFSATADSEPAGTLAAAVASTTVTTLDLSDSSLSGVGDLIRVDDERMVITEKAMLYAGVTLTGNIAASKAVTTVPVSSGADIHIGETIQIGSERMFVESIAGDNLTVTRAEQGTVLAAHVTTDPVFAPRRATVARGQAGTTAATHLISAAITRNLPPALISEGNVSLAINILQQGSAGWATSVGSGNKRQDTGNRRDPVGGALDVLTETLYTAHGRKARSRAVM